MDTGHGSPHKPGLCATVSGGFPLDTVNHVRPLALPINAGIPVF
ncbi:MAG: hypothetical protein SPD11_10885 [Sphaerochaetaceae bacterium]|nr:hypothetical protein [Sphaerochaetaceae bacterium]